MALIAASVFLGFFLAFCTRAIGLVPVTAALVVLGLIGALEASMSLGAVLVTSLLAVCALQVSYLIAAILSDTIDPNARFTLVPVKVRAKTGR